MKKNILFRFNCYINKYPNDLYYLIEIIEQRYVSL